MRVVRAGGKSVSLPVYVPCCPPPSYPEPTQKAHLRPLVAPTATPMLSLLPVTLSFAAPGSRVGLSAPSRLGASTMAATFSDVQGTKDRASNLAIMDELKVLRYPALTPKP